MGASFGTCMESTSWTLCWSQRDPKEVPSEHMDSGLLRGLLEAAEFFAVEDRDGINLL